VKVKWGGGGIESIHHGIMKIIQILAVREEEEEEEQKE
jgi:hypothetical protein